jgi:hypothetical protein
MHQGLDLRVFLSALASAADDQLGHDGREAMLRSLGHHLARLTPLNPVSSLEALELEANEALTAIGWGRASIALDEPNRCLVIRHSGLPRIASKGEVPGYWLAPALEGLYGSWMGQQQPGMQEALAARRQPGVTDGVIELHYARR